MSAEPITAMSATERMEQPATRSRRVADVIVEALVARGVRRVYTVAGESYLALLDALYQSDGIEAITCRHEGSAGFMALADAQLSATIGVCVVNRGPGASNAAIAVHAAHQDATPLVLLVGHVAAADMGMDGFQELDCGPTFAAMSKGVWSITRPESCARILARAFETAVAGTPGPVVVMLPEDVLYQRADGRVAPPVRRIAPRPHADDIAACREMLVRAHRPLVIAGRAVHDRRADLARFCERFQVPVAVANKQQALLANDHPLYAGHLNIATQRSQLALFLEADLVLAVGTRMRDLTSQGHRLPGPGQRFVQVHADGLHLGQSAPCEWPLLCDPGAFLRAMLDSSSDPWSGSALDTGGSEVADADQRQAWIARLHGYEARQASWAHSDEARADPRQVSLGALMDALDARLPDTAIVTIDAGNFTSWVHRYLRFKPSNRLLAIESSAMGFAVPSAISAALARPGQRVVAIVGDGGFLMTGSELATAAMYGLPILFIVANNGSYGTIRGHQERTFPSRVIATELHNPDFVKLAQAYGATGFRIAEPDQLVPVFDQAWQHPGLVLLEVRLPLERISAYRGLVE